MSSIEIATARVIAGAASVPRPPWPVATPSSTKANSPPCASSRMKSGRSARGKPAWRAISQSTMPLTRNRPAIRPNTTQGRADQHREVRAHADRDEEQAEQQALERLDRGLDLVAVLRLGEQHPAEERAERHRQPGVLEGERDHQHEEQREGGEDLAQPRARDVAEHRPREQAAAAERDDDHREPRARASARRMRSRRPPCRAAASPRASGSPRCPGTAAPRRCPGRPWWRARRAR